MRHPSNALGRSQRQSSKDNSKKNKPNISAGRNTRDGCFKRICTASWENAQIISVETDSQRCYIHLIQSHLLLLCVYLFGVAPPSFVIAPTSQRSRSNSKVAVRRQRFYLSLLLSPPLSFSDFHRFRLRQSRGPRSLVVHSG